MQTLHRQRISPFTERLLTMMLVSLSVKGIAGECRWLPFRATTAFKTEASAAPWQSESKKDWDNLRRYQRMPPSIFAPGGRLHSVERAMEALSSSNDPNCNLVIALNCRDGLVVATNGNHPPNAAMFVAGEEGKHRSVYTNTTSANSGDCLLDCTKPEERTSSLWLGSAGGEDASPLPPWSHPSICIVRIPFTENENIFAITAGYALHSQILRHRIRQLADSIYEANDDEIFGGNRSWQQRIRSSLSVAVLARRLADQFQRPTQNQGQKVPRMLVSCALIVGANEGIWQIDPTGQFWQCQVAVVGHGADQARSHLVQKILAKDLSEINGGEYADADATCAQLHSILKNLSIPDALKLARECFQQKMGCKPALARTKASNENFQTDLEPSGTQPHQLFLTFSVLRSRAGRQELE